MSRLTKSLLRQAEARLLTPAMVVAGRRCEADTFLCHAVARAAGEPLSSYEKGATRQEFQARLEFLGIGVSGGYFVELAREFGYDRESVEYLRAAQLLRVMALRIVAAGCPE